MQCFDSLLSTSVHIPLTLSHTPPPASLTKVSSVLKISFLVLLFLVTFIPSLCFFAAAHTQTPLL